MKPKVLHALLFAGIASTLVLSQLQASAPSAPGRALVLQLRGTAIGERRDIDTDGDGIVDTTANCFDVGLFDPRTGNQIGVATDCLSDVGVMIDDDPDNAPLGWNIARPGTTFFHLPGGTLVAQGLTTVRPVLQPTERNGVTFTHVTGANGEGGLRYGEGRFTHSSGSARLSGLVDLARLGSDNEVTFDCLFVVDLDQ